MRVLCPGYNPLMDPLAPFKIRPGSEPLEEAKRIFGTPHEVYVSEPTMNTELRWRIYDYGLDTELTISHREGSEALDISMCHRATDAAFEGDARGSGVAREGLKRFVESVRKPWGEWGEREIMENPVWMALHKEETGGSTPAIETKMVMLSFERPDDHWVKRYFRFKSCRPTF